MIEINVHGGSSLCLSPSKIICLIRSFAAHAEEMGSEPSERPLFFLKPPSSLIGSGSKIIVPKEVSQLHHEVELAIIIGKRGKDIAQEDAMEHIGYYLPVLDLTARDIQSEAKIRGLPWSAAKGFDTFAPVGPVAYPARGMDYRGRRIWLKVNGETRQDSTTDLLLFSIERIISDISKVMTLEEGDIIMTGTPAGVGPIEPGDIVTAGIEGMEPMEFRVA